MLPIFVMYIAMAAPAIASPQHIPTDISMSFGLEQGHPSLSPSSLLGATPPPKRVSRVDEFVPTAHQCQALRILPASTIVHLSLSNLDPTSGILSLEATDGAIELSNTQLNEIYSRCSLTGWISHIGQQVVKATFPRRETQAIDGSVPAAPLLCAAFNGGTKCKIIISNLLGRIGIFTSALHAAAGGDADIVWESRVDSAVNLETGQSLDDESLHSHEFRSNCTTLLCLSNTVATFVAFRNDTSAEDKSWYGPVFGRGHSGESALCLCTNRDNVRRAVWLMYFGSSFTSSGMFGLFLPYAQADMLTWNLMRKPP